tara:strand:+ start:77 stop:823 length:747 start_codon:yes stop_codon:yes gene_type:complete
MGVSTDQNVSFSMFGPTDGSDTTTIQGAIDEGNNGAVDGDITFTELVAASTPSKFDSSYAGGVITNTNQITEATQFRGYPVPDDESSANSGGASNFGNGNLIGHFGTTGFSTLSWRVFLDIDGYSDKTVTIGPNSNCLHGCSYTSAARRNSSETITGNGTITVTRLADSSSNSNNEVNDDGDVQLVVSGGTIGHNGGADNSDGNPARFLSNTKGVYTFNAGETFSKTFSFTNMLVADGDTFQLDITEG